MSASRLILPPGYVALREAEKSVLYCDESGNSGPNYLDQQQPFYVLAGWVVPDSINEAVWVAVEELRKQIAPQADEIKSDILKRGEHKKNALADFFELLGRRGCIPLYLIAEKRYCVAGKIVETFLDPYYNPLLCDGFTGDRESKQELANQLYELLPDDVLRQFADAYRQPNSKGFTDALQAVASAAGEHLSAEHKYAFDGSSARIEEIAEAEASTSTIDKVNATLNMPCLISFLMMAENLGRVGLHRPIQIVHDRHHTYEDGYRKIFELHQGLPRLFARLPDEDLTYQGLEAVAEFETDDSKQRLPIQAADLLAGTINHLMKLAMNGSTPSDGDVRLARLTLPGLFVTGVKLAWPIWSDKCIGRVGSSLIITALPTTSTSADERQKARSVAQAQKVPLIPVAGRRSEQEARYSLPCPMYALIGKRSDNIMILTPTDEDVRESDGQAVPVVPLFSSKELAESFLEMIRQGALTEDQCVVEYDGGDTLNLMALLDDASEYSEVVVFDPGSENQQHMYMPALVAGCRAMMNRVARLLGSGLDNVVMERSSIGGNEALSMLMSDGEYGAMWAPVGQVVKGNTREEALQRLRIEVPPPSSADHDLPPSESGQ